MAEASEWRNVYLIPAIVGLVTSFIAIMFARETDAFIDSRLKHLRKTEDELMQEKLEEKSASISLIVTVSDNAGNIDQYDIPVSLEDNEWNISSSRHGGTCSIALIAEYADGSKDVLAKSNKLQLASSYWLENSEDMKANDSLYKIYMSLLSTKEGSIIENSIARETSLRYGKEDVNE